MTDLWAELLLLRKRVAVWVLFGFWALAVLLFQYALPYYAYTNNLNFHERGTGFAILLTLLPQNFIANVISTIPFYGGLVVLIMGVLSVGSEYTWGTLTPIFTQQSSRLRVFLTKIAGIGIAIIPFVLVAFFIAFVASLLIAWREGQAIALPSGWDFLKAVALAWFIMAVWTAFGIVVSVLSRGTALAASLSIIYALVIETIISALGREVDLLNSIARFFLRSNSYTLISASGLSPVSESGPGGFTGPALSGTFSLILLGCYVLLFIGASAAIVRYRDIAGAG